MRRTNPSVVDTIRRFFAQKGEPEQTVRVYQSTVRRRGNHVTVGHPRPLAKLIKPTHQSDRTLVVR